MDSSTSNSTPTKTLFKRPSSSLITVNPVDHEKAFDSKSKQPVSTFHNEFNTNLTSNGINGGFGTKGSSIEELDGHGKSKGSQDKGAEQGDLREPYWFVKQVAKRPRLSFGE